MEFLTIIFLIFIFLSIGPSTVTVSKRTRPSVEWDALKAKWSLPISGAGLVTGVVSKILSAIVPNKVRYTAETLWDMLPSFPIETIKKIMPKFTVLPRTHKEATDKRWLGFGSTWKKVSEKCECDPAKQKHFLGARYVKDKDWSLVLLMDQNGLIVGIQSNVDIHQFAPPKPLRGYYYIQNGNFWSQTVYFVDPNIICSGDGRGDPTIEGTGTGLWIQRGPNPKRDFQKIPMDENEANAELWGSGKCFPTMGRHSWYNVLPDMDCMNFVPYCLLYNKNRLTGFCFIKNTQIPHSSRYDFPSISKTSFKLLMDPVPQCFENDQSYQKLRSIHVYFKSDAETDSNC